MKEMEEGITSKTLTEAQKIRQIQMLDDYKKYNNVGWDLFHYYQGYNWDTARLNDPNEVRLKLLKFYKAQNLSVSSVSNVMKNTFIGTMKDATLSLDAGLRSLINVQIGAAGEILSLTAGDIFRQGGLSQYDRNQIMLATETSLVDYAVQTGAMVKGKPLGSYTNAILMGEKSVARYVQALKNSADIRIANNPFVKNLVAFIDKRKGWPSTISLGERDYDTYTSNVWTDAFRELKDDHAVISINDNPDDDKTVAQIYNNMVIAAIIQSGSKKTSTSLSHLVPNESYSEFTRDALKNMRLEGFYENLVLYRSNWNNDKLVPIVQMEYNDENDPEYGTYPFFRGTESKVTNSLKDMLGEEPAALLAVPEWKYKNNKAIKIKITRDPNTGERYATPIVRLFQKVSVQEEEGESPLKAYLGKKPSNRILFKEINAWGDGNNVQEYHEGTTQSILPNNRKVNEISNDQLVYALKEAGYTMNIADMTIDQAIQRIQPNDDGGDTDEETGNEEDPKDPTVPPPPSAPDTQFEPEDNIEECNPKFTIKNQE